MQTDDTITELRDRIQQLEAKLDARESRDAPDPQRFGRRHLLAAAGGAIAGGVLAAAKPAGAADGDPLILGQTNTATNDTLLNGRLSVDNPTGGAFTVHSGSAASFASHVSGEGIGLLVEGAHSALWAFNENTDSPAVSIANKLGPGLLVTVGESPGTDPGRKNAIAAGSLHPEPMPLWLEGGRAHALFSPRAEIGPPPTLVHDKGEVALDANTDLHVCNTAGTPGTWHRVLTNRTSAGAGSGATSVLDRPFRLYDSRPASGGVLPGPKSPLTPGSRRTLDVVGQGSPPVPDDAVAVIATISVANTGSQGILRGYATGSAFPSQPLLYWSASNQRAATTTIIRLRTAGSIDLEAFTTPTDVIVDVVGWIA
jgi:hypothetical protein